MNLSRYLIREHIYLDYNLQILLTNILIVELILILNFTEYAYTLKVDEKSDVYSFGVVLLELVSGRKPVGEFGDGVDIVQWVRKMTDGKKEGVLKILDPRLPTVPIQDVMHVFYVAMLCVEEQAVERPTMREVVQILTELPKPPNAIVTEPLPSQPAAAESPKETKEQPPQSPPPDLLSI